MFIITQNWADKVLWAGPGGSKKSPPKSKGKKSGSKKKK